MWKSVDEISRNKSVHKTNIKTVDTLLKGMYARIKEQHDHPEKFGLHIV